MMAGDRDTLPEPQRLALVRAAFHDDADSRQLVEHSLHGPHVRGRVLALRAATRHGWIRNDEWTAALRDENSDVRREAATLLSRGEMTETLQSLLIDALNDDDPLVVDAAAFALGEAQCRFAVPALMKLATSHDDARCRECAVAALGNIGDDRSRAVIISALNDKPSVRRRAVVALANFEGSDVEEALARARDDRDWQVRAAVDQLDRSDDDD